MVRLALSGKPAGWIPGWDATIYKELLTQSPIRNTLYLKFISRIQDRF